MPRASWRGFLRLSLVSCPIYLSPATTRAKSIRLHQVWQPAPVDVDEDDLPDRGGGRQGSAPSVTRLPVDNASADGDQSPAATRVTLRPRRLEADVCGADPRRRTLARPPHQRVRAPSTQGGPRGHRRRLRRTQCAGDHCAPTAFIQQPADLTSTKASSRRDPLARSPPSAA